MQFSSVTYLLFLAIAASVYFALPGVRSRTAWLLVCSYGFYYSISASWSAVLLGITIAGYALGRVIASSRGDAVAGSVPRATRGPLVAGIVVAAGTLAVFKYAGVSAWALREALSFVDSSGRFEVLRLALPVGISFWTFQTIAYLVDVAKGVLPAEKNLARYALFVAFFPQVTAGPIARGGQLLPQLAEKHAFSYDGMRSGLLLMLWGFFKKLVVADSLAVSVGTLFGDPHKYGGEPLLLMAGSVAFAVQLYCDFSGYTDIVRGSARLFGIDLALNFDRPYAARSVKEFWRRWHMSLMGWLKEYIYIPMGGSRVPSWRRRLNILAVFLVSGIWHGAGLTFVVWGLLNGLYQLAGEWLAPARGRVARALRLGADSLPLRIWQTAVTFALVTIAWVFFRAESMADALYILSHMLALKVTPETRGLLALGLPTVQLKVTVIATVVVFAGEWLAARRDVLGWLLRAPLPLRWAAYYAAIFSVVIFGYYGSTYSAAAFAYFKF